MPSLDLAELRSDLLARMEVGADPAIAPSQQRYMKSKLPFWGLRAEQVASIRKAWEAERLSSATPEELLTLSHLLAERAEHREEVYAAIGILDHGKLEGCSGKLAVMEKLILLHPWWDVTDTLQRPLRKLLLHGEAREATVAQVRAWIAHESFWVRRESLIAQITLKSRVDTGLLTEAIEANMGDSEFFVAKAIGWALRDYARTDPTWVRAFVSSRPLQPLSKKEALKRIGA